MANRVPGVFVAAPIGGLLWGFGALALRLSIQYIMSWVKGHRFDAFDRPAPRAASFVEQDGEYDTAIEHSDDAKKNGRFF